MCIRDRRMPAAGSSRRAAAAVSLALALAGCGMADYYWQGAAGQLDVVARAKPLDPSLIHISEPTRPY